MSSACPNSGAFGGGTTGGSPHNFTPLNPNCAICSMCGETLLVDIITESSGTEKMVTTARVQNLKKETEPGLGPSPARNL